MPFGSTESLPAYVKKYSPKIQRQFLHVWNSVFKKTGSEVRAFKAGNSVLKKRFKGPKGMEKNSQDDYFKHLIDRYLGNLRG